MWGFCHGVSSVLLPAHADRTRLAVPHAPVDVAKCFRSVPDDTGAPPTTADRAKIEGIVHNISGKNYGFRSLIHEIVQSETFQTK